jgi:hypothetical protein
MMAVHRIPLHFDEAVIRRSRALRISVPADGF